MANESASSSAANDLSKSRGWLIIGGIFSVFLGFSAIGSRSSLHHPQKHIAH